MSLVTERNRGVVPARSGEFAPLRLGDRITLRTPVVLAPMAGVTSAPYRVLCRGYGEALYLSEMISARGLVGRNRKTLLLARFMPEERCRALQVHGTDASYLEEAARYLVGELGVELIDLNLGCPVRKITAAGGGAAIPQRPRLLAALLRALTKGAGSVPVTMKMRLGIDQEHPSFLEAGRIAEAEGLSAVGLHARTAAQLYSGDADWSRIAELASALTIPVLGNGDIQEAHDALRMMRETGCRGVIIGRACLGRPWLFRELEALFRGEDPPSPPRFHEVRACALRHARLLMDFVGSETGLRHMRKFAPWYCKSFPGSREIRGQLGRVSTLDELRGLLGRIPGDAAYPIEALRTRRCKGGAGQKVALPPGWLLSEPG